MSLDPEAQADAWMERGRAGEGAEAYHRARDLYLEAASGATSGGEGYARMEAARRAELEWQLALEAEVAGRGESLRGGPPYFEELAGEVCDVHRARRSIPYSSVRVDADGARSALSGAVVAVLRDKDLVAYAVAVWRAFRELAVQTGAAAARPELLTDDFGGAARDAIVSALLRLPPAGAPAPLPELLPIRTDVADALDAWLQDIGFRFPRTPDAGTGFETLKPELWVPPDRPDPNERR